MKDTVDKCGENDFDLHLPIVVGEMLAIYDIVM